MGNPGGIEERSAVGSIVWRKVDQWILPVCTMLFLLNAVDKTNIGNARIVGLQASLNLSNYEYTVALTVTYIPFVFAVIPSNLIMKHVVGPDIFLPTMAIMWGIAAGAQGLVSNYSGLLACRFFIGLAESGLFPGIVLYLSFFYPREKLQTRIAAFYMLGCLAGTFSGLLAAIMDKLGGMGGRPGWAWIFILEGLFTIVFGAISFFLLPCSPEEARFFTEKERQLVVSTLKHAGSISEKAERDRFSWAEVVRAAKSPHVWLLTINSLFGGAILFALVYFAPSIVAGLGYKGNRAQLMSVPPFVAAFVLSVISAVISDRHQCRGYTAIFFSTLQVVGASMYYAGKSDHIRYASLFFSISGAFGGTPSQTAWLANNSTPHTRRATAIGMAFITAQLGAILGIWLLGYISPAPNYTSAEISFIAMSVSMVVIAIVNMAYLGRENRLKAMRRERMTKEEEPECLGDRSAWFIYSM